MIKRGFTLIELLVVVAIVAILIAIIAPVVLRSKSGNMETPSTGPVYESSTTPIGVRTSGTGQQSTNVIELLPGQKFIAFETKQGVRVPITVDRSPDEKPKRHQVDFEGQRFVVIEK